MTEPLAPTPQSVTPRILEQAAAAYCCRFGEPEREARRRGCIHAMQRSSRRFATALEQFTARGAPHVRGEHSSADMRGEVDALLRALADWTSDVNAAADACGDDQQGTVAGEERAATT
ncbi:MAG: hypothetical protein M3Z05_01125 [Gemmatimonadota bacterium]|nr:hypothetical protein [Gemmatimonadota bacterium]